MPERFLLCDDVASVLFQISVFQGISTHMYTRTNFKLKFSAELLKFPQMRVTAHVTMYCQVTERPQISFCPFGLRRPSSRLNIQLCHMTETIVM